MQEYFADYIAINSDLFSLNIQSPEFNLFVESSKTWDTSALARTTEGIASVLLSLKKKPLIRYESNSALAKKLAAELTVPFLVETFLNSTIIVCHSKRRPSLRFQKNRYSTYCFTTRPQKRSSDSSFKSMDVPSNDSRTLDHHKRKSRFILSQRRS